MFKSIATMKKNELQKIVRSINEGKIEAAIESISLLKFF